ncbi:hypothetical protein PsorP6_002747 [Peronosclerospora sorghi]|uniref:Uncharacterized protein n=1 Tax=Peronosclerospora sorghi TaxID=230839 RepID=A0ACC0WVQ7_9STRA|nr:hypothetical protein PsorP6_002747 [Peronosclerospora sorghi]
MLLHGRILYLAFEVLDVLVHALDQRRTELVLGFELRRLVVQFFLELRTSTTHVVHKFTALVHFGIATFLRCALVSVLDGL